MPNKPRDKIQHGRQQGSDKKRPLTVNKHAVAGRSLRKYGNPEHIQFALEAMLADVEDGNAQAGRYGRVRTAIAEHFSCNRWAAEDAIRGARSYNADVFADERNVRVPEVCAQLQRIADGCMIMAPAAAVTALKEINSVLGAHQPLKVDVTHGAAAPLELHAIIGVLDADGRAALSVVLAQIDAAKASGRLLVEGDDVEDAELVEAGN